MTPLKAFDDAVMGVTLLNNAKDIPGDLIRKMTSEIREGLSRLTSDHIADVHSEYLRYHIETEKWFLDNKRSRIRGRR